MSPIILRATSSDARSSNPQDRPNQPIQRFDHQDLAPAKIDPQDTENLIAMASMVSLLPRESEPRFLAGRYWESSIDSWFFLLMLTFRAQARFAKVLDSVANLSVADSQYRVIAVALNITSCSTNWYMAGNHGVPLKTVSHIKKLWSLLQDISMDYADYNRDDAQPDSKSPK